MFSRADRVWHFPPTRGLPLLTVPPAPYPVIPDIGQIDEEVPPRFLWSRTRRQPTLLFAPSTLHVSTRPCFGVGRPRCSFRRNVYGQCPAPFGISQGQAAGRAPIRDLVHPLHTNLLLARLCHRNCATPPTEWPHFLYGSAPLANAVGSRSCLRRYRVLGPTDRLLT